MIGISLTNSQQAMFVAGENVAQGLTVGAVQTGGPADKAGIKAGDVITKFDGKDVKTFQELNKLKDKHKPGDSVVITVTRDGTAKVFTVTLGEEKN